MTMIFHLFKTDVRRLRVLLGVWLLPILFLSVLACWDVNLGFRSFLGSRAMSHLAPSLQLIMFVVIIPLLIHEEPLVGTTAFWLARPIARTDLLWAKTWFAGMLVALPLFVRIGVLTFSGATAHDIVLAALEMALNQLSLIVLIALVAIFTANFGRYAVTAVVCLVAGLILFGVFVKVCSHYGIGITSLEIALSKSRGVVECLVVVLGGGTVIAHQYLTRKTTRSLVLAGFVIVGVFAVFGFWPWNFFDLPLIPALSATRDISTAKLELGSTEIREERIPGELGGVRTFIDGVIATKGLSDDLVISRPVQVHSRLRNLKDEVSISFNSALQENATPEYLPVVTAMEVALGNVPVVNSVFQPGGQTALFFYEPKFEKYLHQPLRYTGVIDFVASRYRVDLAIPVVRGARFDRGSEHAAITEVLHQGSGVEIVVFQNDVELLFDRSSGVTAGFGFSSEQPKPRDMVYLLRNRKRNEAVLDTRYSDRNADEVTEVRNGQSVKRLLRLRFGAEFNAIAPEMTPAWLADAELVRLQLVPVGTFSKNLVVENFRLDRDNVSAKEAEPAPRFDPRRFARVVLPENATKAQVKDYVNAILMASQYRDDWEEQDPQAAMLLKVGPENLDVLLSAANHRSGTKKLFLDYAIRKMARREDKALILGSLATNPNLAELVYKFHWREEAHDTLLAGLRDENATWFPAPWIEMVASFRDPATYPDLKAFLLRSSDPHWFFETIKGLPGIDLSDTAEAIWKRGQYREGSDLLDAGAIALEFGHEDALAALVGVLAHDDDEGYRAMAGSYLRDYTAATGDDKALLAWYEANKNNLAFDTVEKKFVVNSVVATPASPEKTKDATAH